MLFDQQVEDIKDYEKSVTGQNALMTKGRERSVNVALDRTLMIFDNRQFRYEKTNKILLVFLAGGAIPEVIWERG